jgi:hypothetical protein
MVLRLLLLLTFISSHGCAIQPADPVMPKPANPAPQLAIPQPPASLPKPYTGASIQPATPEEQEYTNYLLSTALLPDQAICDRNLLQRMQGVAKPGSMKRDWVTKPFLAWGGIWKVGAVVGPVEHLYSITEAHVTWQNQQGQERKSTYSCYVQYARQPEVGIWRIRHLKYGSYTNEGHKKYASGPAAPFTSAPPGPDTGSEPGIKYYRVE